MVDWTCKGRNLYENYPNCILHGYGAREDGTYGSFIMYSLLWNICEELNNSIGITLIVFYLQSVIDLVNMSHILYWNFVVVYSHMETIGVISYGVTILMPMWDLIIACERCQIQVNTYSQLLNNKKTLGCIPYR